ncbi:MAG: beta-ketoacyl synthase chain length factor [Cellvibrionaceae bacterium]|nr:beta-ketoacyl synthase chain length factor [Cellvibrionaceae bacterium]
MTMQIDLTCYVYGLGAWGPGFANWGDLQAQLLDPARIPADLTAPPPKAEVIPGNERRRAPPVVRAAVEVSAQATQAAGVGLGDLACVFGSGLGDTEITDYMCTQLATPEKQLSPTRFHNSVHNAPAGYWTIATHCMRSANSIAAYNQTAGISLMEAATQARQEQVPVLVTLYDLCARGIYSNVYTVDQDFAAALVISPSLLAHPPLAKLTMKLAPSACAEPAWAPSFAHLCANNPAARVLPLLHGLALPAPQAEASLELAAGIFLKILIEK